MGSFKGEVCNLFASNDTKQKTVFKQVNQTVNHTESPAPNTHLWISVAGLVKMVKQTAMFWKWHSVYTFWGNTISKVHTLTLNTQHSAKSHRNPLMSVKVVWSMMKSRGSDGLESTQVMFTDI